MADDVTILFGMDMVDNVSAKLQELLGKLKGMGSVFTQHGQAADRLASAHLAVNSAARDHSAATQALTSAQFGGKASATEVQAAEDKVTQTKLAHTAATKELNAAEKDASITTGVSNAALLGSVGILGAVGAGLGFVADKAIKFQSVDGQLAANLGLTQQQAQQWGDAFLQASTKTTASASDMISAFAPQATALKELNNGVLTTAQSTTFMTNANELAEATHSDLTSTTSGLISVMREFHIPLSDTAEAMNELDAMNKVTGQSAGQLSTNMGRSAKDVVAAGLSINDLTAIQKEFVTQGYPARQAIAMQSQAIKAIVEPSTAAKKEFAALGVSLTDAKGNALPFTTILGNAKTAIDAIKDPTKKAAAEQAIFGGNYKDMLGFLEGGPALLASNVKQINALGDAHAGAEAAVPPLTKAQDELRNTMDMLEVTIGEKVLPALTQMVATVTPIITAVLSWIATHPELIKDLVLVAAGIAAVVLALKTFEMIMGVVDALMDTNPWVLAIMAVIVVILLIITHFQLFKQVVSDVVNAVTGFLSGLWDGIKGAVTDVVDFISQHWQLLLAIFLGPLGIVLGFVISHFTQIKNFISGIIGDIGAIIGGIPGFFASIPGAIGGFLSGIGTAVTNAFTSAVDGVIGFINTFLKDIGDFGWGGFGWGPFSMPSFHVRDLFGGTMFQIPTLDVGGDVTATGLALVHEGEQVVPAQTSPLSSTGSGTVHVHIEMNNNTISDAKTMDDFIDKIQARLVGTLLPASGMVIRG